ncbi:transposase [Streptomyces sp. NPDC088115]|uniref:transposase n=1 Tax=Streptomyces sp. NPDC088115 TaxID=3365824 RepID=UPI003821F767
MAPPVRVRRLTEQGGQRLQQIVRRGSTNTVRYRRAMMLLASAGGNTVPVIARLVAADEDTVRGPLGIRPTAGSCWAQLSKPDRLPATYHRTHGVTYFHGCYAVGTDRLWGVNRRRKGAGPTLAALKSIRAARPDGAPIYVILDNLSAHCGTKIRAWAARNKVELCFTPTYTSWANPIEAHFGPLRQFTLANSNHPNHPVQTRALHAYLRWRNANARHPDIVRGCS